MEIVIQGREGRKKINVRGEVDTVFKGKKCKLLTGKLLIVAPPNSQLYGNQVRNIRCTKERGGERLTYSVWTVWHIAQNHP